jgi:hypothetical protein
MKQILLTQEQYNALKERVSGAIPVPDQDVIIPDLEVYYITNSELMSILKISRRTAARWRETGHLPYIKIEHTLYYPTNGILNSFGTSPSASKLCGHSPPVVDDDPCDEIPVMQCEKCPLFLLMKS